MTFVGKILVIIIMVFAIFFLALSTVVFSTAVNWKEETKKRNDEVSKLKSTASKLDADAKARQADLDTAKAQHKRETDTLQNTIKDLTSQNDLRQKEITDQRTEVEKAQETARQSLAESEARVKEADVLRTNLKQVQDQANEYKLRQTELNDEIRILKRELETATNNNKSLRERVAAYSDKLRSLGQSDDIRVIKGVGQPPDVEGEIDRVDARGSRVEITIGSDDGLVEGHELYVWRTKPTPEFIGKIKIISVDPDRAVGEVIGRTIQGKKIQEHDIVSTKIQSRG
jgi:hypothetical protein